MFEQVPVVPVLWFAVFMAIVFVGVVRERRLRRRLRSDGRLPEFHPDALCFEESMASGTYTWDPERDLGSVVARSMLRVMVSPCDLWVRPVGPLLISERFVIGVPLSSIEEVTPRSGGHRLRWTDAGDGQRRELLLRVHDKVGFLAALSAGGVPVACD